MGASQVAEAGGGVCTVEEDGINVVAVALDFVDGRIEGAGHAEGVSDFVKSVCPEVDDIACRKWCSVAGGALKRSFELIGRVCQRAWNFQRRGRLF